jgi:hypothetical protein
MVLVLSQVPALGSLSPLPRTRMPRSDTAREKVRPGLSDTRITQSAERADAGYTSDLSSDMMG